MPSIPASVTGTMCGSSLKWEVFLLLTYFYAIQIISNHPVMSHYFYQDKTVLQDASRTRFVCRELECKVSVEDPYPRVTGFCISLRQLISCLCVNCFPLHAFYVQNEYMYKFLVGHLCKSRLLSSLSIKGGLSRTQKVLLWNPKL